MTPRSGSRRRSPVAALTITIGLGLATGCGPDSNDRATASDSLGAGGANASGRSGGGSIGGVTPSTSPAESLPVGEVPAVEPAPVDSTSAGGRAGGPAPTDLVEAGADAGSASADEARAEPVDLWEHHDPIESVRVRPVLVATTRSAVDLAVRPGDDALYIVEHEGRVIRDDGGEQSVSIDIADRLVGHGNEQGLTGLEFDGDGATAFLHHTDAAGSTRVSSFAVTAEGSFDPRSETVLIDVGPPAGFHHNAGDLLVAPDGTLLVTLGDGDIGVRPDADGVVAADTPVRPALEPDPHRVASDPSSLRGSILRILPTPDGPEPYEIPADNPFAGGPLTMPDGGVVDGRPEVLAWGLRNPWKIDLDDASGALWVADVGLDSFEEINVAVPVGDRPAGWGLDFGWSRFEGTAPRNTDVATRFGPPVDPFHQYPHDGIRCAISGGVVYRGALLPELRSGYVFADFCEGSVRVLDVTSGATRVLFGLDGEGGIPGVSGVRVGPDGELYVLSWFGPVHRLVRA